MADFERLGFLRTSQKHRISDAMDHWIFFGKLGSHRPQTVAIGCVSSAFPLTPP